MSDPIRLREEGSALDRSLLDSAKADAPSDGAEARALAALGLAAGASLVPAEGATKSFFALRLATISKIGIAVALVAGAAAFVVHERRSRPPPASTSVAPNAESSAIAPPIDTEPVPSATAAPTATSSGAPRGTNEVAPPPKSKAVLPSYASEQKMIEDAQAARGSNPERALAIVDLYRHRPGPHQFEEEAALIAVEASWNAGDKVRTKREALDFLQRYPQSPYRPRVEPYLDALRKSEAGSAGD